MNYVFAMEVLYSFQNLTNYGARISFCEVTAFRDSADKVSDVSMNISMNVRKQCGDTMCNKLPFQQLAS